MGILASTEQIFERQFAKDKRGKNVAPFPKAARNKVLKAATELELTHGRPVMRNEVWVSMKK